MAINRTHNGSVAEDSLAWSSMQRDIGGMSSPVPPGANGMNDALTNAGAMNYQVYNNHFLDQANFSQNAESAANQAGVGATRKVGSGLNQLSDAENKAQQLINTRVAEVLYANQSGSKIMELTQNIDNAALKADLMTGKALAAGINPEIGQAVAQQYMYS